MTQLYVGNLSAEGDEKAIRMLFGKYGQVREVLMKNGYSFVEFESPMSADEAVRELNGLCNKSSLLNVGSRTSLPMLASMKFYDLEDIT